MIFRALKAAIGGHVLVVGLMAGAITLAVGWDSSRKARWLEAGRQEVVQRSEQEGNRNAEEARKVHDAARRAGAFERLRKDARACPDCPR